MTAAWLLRTLCEAHLARGSAALQVRTGARQRGAPVHPRSKCPKAVLLPRLPTLQLAGAWKHEHACWRSLSVGVLATGLFCGASKGNCHPTGVRCNPGTNLGQGTSLQQSTGAVVLTAPAMLTHSAYSSQGLLLWQPHTWDVCHQRTKYCSATLRRLSTAQHCRKQVALHRTACARRRTGKQCLQAAFTPKSTDAAFEQNSCHRGANTSPQRKAASRGPRQGLARPAHYFWCRSATRSVCPL